MAMASVAGLPGRTRGGGQAPAENANNSPVLRGGSMGEPGSLFGLRVRLVLRGVWGVWGASEGGLGTVWQGKPPGMGGRGR